MGTSYIPPVKPILLVHDYEGLKISPIFGNTKRFGLTQAEGEMEKASFAQETSETMWNIIQAYTGLARAPELTVEAAYRLERVGGQILSMVK